MVTKVEIRGYQEFKKYVDNMNQTSLKTIFYFTGSKLPTGKSWCPDCVEAEPVVRKFVDQAKKHVVFGFVDVGDIKAWGSLICPFRTDPVLKLLVLPTILVWKGVQRLEGSQCLKLELLNLLLEDAEEARTAED